jgi:hypothetical protein
MSAHARTFNVYFTANMAAIATLTVTADIQPVTFNIAIDKMK